MSSLNEHIEERIVQKVLEDVLPNITDQIVEKIRDLLSADEYGGNLDAIVEQRAADIARQLASPPRMATQFPSLEAFVNDFIGPMYALTQTRKPNWSTRWFKHPEAVARLNTLWCCYERCRTDDPEGFLESYLRVHADYHMDRLMREGGIFADCRSEEAPVIPLGTDFGEYDCGIVHSVPWQAPLYNPNKTN